MDNVEIVPARSADAPLLAECRFAMFVDMSPETDYSGIREEFIAAAGRHYEDRILSPDQLTLFAKIGKETAGCGTIIFQERPPGVKHMRNLYGYILNIYVKPEYRKRGIATLIMRALQEEAGRRGAKRVGLHASAAGANVYKKLGYVVKENYMENEL